MTLTALRHRLARTATDPAAPLPRLPLAVFQLAGSQATMGAQHGALQRAIGGHAPVQDYYPRMTARLLRGSEAGWLERRVPLLVAPMVAQARRLLAAGRPREYRARSAAFCAALGLPARHSQHMLTIDVLQNLIGLAGRLGVGPFAELVQPAAVPACSTLAVWGDASEQGRLLHARNLDFPGAGVWDTRPSVVFCSPERGLRYGFVSARGADLPGVTAFNEAGLVLTTHTRFTHRVGLSGASLVDLGHRIISSARTLEQAVQVASEHPSAAGWGLLVSSAEERDALLIEVAPGRLEVVRPTPGQPWAVSTNLYQAPPLRVGEVGIAPGWQIQAWGRWRVLLRTAHKAFAGAPLDVPGLTTLLGSHEDPDVPGFTRAAGGVLAQSTSVQSVVVDPERRCLHVSVGRCPTGHGPYVEVGWEWGPGPGVRQLADASSAAPAPGSRPPQAAYQRFLQAARLEAVGAAPEHTERALLQASELDPDDPTYRLLSGGVWLRRRQASRALQEFEAGLQQERSPYCRGRLHLWAARAALVAGQPGLAAAHRSKLACLAHPLLGPLQQAAAAEVERPANARRLARVGLHVQLGDIG